MQTLSNKKRRTLAKKFCEKPKRTCCLSSITYLSNMTTPSSQSWIIPILPSFLPSFKLFSPESLEENTTIHTERVTSSPTKEFSYYFLEVFKFCPGPTLVRTLLTHWQNISIIVVTTPPTLSGGSFLRIAEARTFSSYPDSCRAASQAALLSLREQNPPWTPVLEEKVRKKSNKWRKTWLNYEK